MLLLNRWGRGFRPVADVANRMGDSRRPFLRKVSFCDTRPVKAVQGGVLSSL